MVRGRYFQIIIKAAVIFLYFIVPDAIAQTKAAQSNLSTRNEIGTDNSIVLMGKLTDYHSNKAVSGIIVKIDNTTFTDTTDKYGRFNLKLSGTIKDTLELIAINGETEDAIVLPITLYKDSLLKEEIIKLYRYPIDKLEEVVLTAYFMPIVNFDDYDINYEVKQKKIYAIEPTYVICPIEEVEFKSSSKQSLWEKLSRFFGKKEKQ